MKHHPAVTANIYPAQAGPVSSVLGMALGALIMLVIAWNYASLMRACPEVSGAYAYTREAFVGDENQLHAHKTPRFAQTTHTIRSMCR